MRPFTHTAIGAYIIGLAASWLRDRSLFLKEITDILYAPIALAQEFPMYSAVVVILVFAWCAWRATKKRS